MSGERIVVAMSGGVDSSVAAALLVEAGAEVIGVTLHLAGESSRCCSLADADDARRVAERLGIPLSNFQSRVIDDAGWRGIFQDIVARVQDGRYRDILDRTFPLAEIADAHRYMEENRAAGKVVGLL